MPADDSVPSPTARKGPLGRALKVGLAALVPLAVVVLLAEVALWVAGVADPVPHFSLSRGFDENARYLTPDPAVDGGYRTQFWGSGQDFDIQPRGRLRRALLLGGSNTFSFPETVVLDDLNRITTGPGWEVINLGRPGYGSERVRILLGQALDALEPEAVLIYSGHNEFVERSFQAQLFRHGGGLKRRLLVALSHLRLFRAVQDVFKTPGGAPEVVQHSSVEFRGLAYRDTLQFYETYRDNLRAMCEAALSRGVDVVLCTIVGNMMMPPQVTTLPEHVTRQAIVDYRMYFKQGITGLPPRLTDVLHPAIRPNVRDWGMALHWDVLAERMARPPVDEPAPLRPLDGPLADMPATKGKKHTSIEGAHWTEPRTWEEPARRIMATMAGIHQRELNTEELQAVRRSYGQFARALEIIPEQPDALFFQGLCAYLLGKDDEARELLELAGDFDRAPRRGNRITNGIVRDVAAEFPEVVLLDLDQMIKRHVPDGIVGYEVMVDVCHTQPGVRPFIARQFAEALVRATEDGAD